jgi:hypothetical protein
MASSGRVEMSSELAAVVAAWPHLDDNIQSRILAMIAASPKQQ